MDENNIRRRKNNDDDDADDDVMRGQQRCKMLAIVETEKEKGRIFLLCCGKIDVV